MKSAITIRQLSKIYNRTGEVHPYATLRDMLSNILKKQKFKKTSFCALQNINLDVKQGERIGIIGRNGAGKSTLLKIISRITPPTSGSIVLNGRIASLLEVGTGFHPELSGRENIYLNGSILGLKRTEINAELKNIIDFSGVAAFIDTPLKHYSSGMQLRLAFAVAAHLESEILLIDEVLAVGDIEFQKKCLGKMDEISKQKGRTILFVSHDIEAVTRLCSSAVWLEGGVLKLHSTIGEVISGYVNENYSKTDVQYSGPNDPSKAVCITECCIVSNYLLPNVVSNGERLILKLRIAVNKKHKFSFEFLIRDGMRGPLLFLPVGLAHGREHLLDGGTYEVTITTPLPHLTKDRYFIDVITADTNKSYIHYLESALFFDIQAKVFEEQNFVYESSQRMGKVLLTDAVTIDIK